VHRLHRGSFLPIHEWGRLLQTRGPVCTLRHAPPHFVRICKGLHLRSVWACIWSRFWGYNWSCRIPAANGEGEKSMSVQRNESRLATLIISIQRIHTCELTKASISRAFALLFAPTNASEVAPDDAISDCNARRREVIPLLVSRSVLGLERTAFSLWPRGVRLRC